MGKEKSSECQSVATERSVKKRELLRKVAVMTESECRSTLNIINNQVRENESRREGIKKA